MTKRGAPQFPLRFPDGMRDEIKATAEANGRTMNAEIIARLSAGEPKCAFCGCERSDHRRLVFGPEVAICEPCARLTVDIFALTSKGGV